MKKNKLTFLEIKKYFKEKGFILSKKKINPEDNSISVLSRTFLSSLIIVSIFFVLPVIVQFADERGTLSKEFKNNSKDGFEKVLDNENLKKLSKMTYTSLINLII